MLIVPARYWTWWPGMRDKSFQLNCRRGLSSPENLSRTTVDHTTFRKSEPWVGKRSSEKVTPTANMEFRVRDYLEVAWYHTIYEWKLVGQHWQPTWENPGLYHRSPRIRMLKSTPNPLSSSTLQSQDSLSILLSLVILSDGFAASTSDNLAGTCASLTVWSKPRS